METVENEKSRTVRDPGMIPEGFVYRDQRKRYPLPDVSLEFASQTYFQSGVDIDDGLIRGFRKLREIIDDQVHTPEELGVERWQGREEEASAMIEKAAVHLGAAQVGFTALDLTVKGVGESSTG